MVRLADPRSLTDGLTWAQLPPIGPHGAEDAESPEAEKKPGGHFPVSMNSSKPARFGLKTVIHPLRAARTGPTPSASPGLKYRETWSSEITMVNTDCEKTLPESSANQKREPFD